ncbi:hypothetical protein, partial [Burkholderia gladioli]|uniref:hypothetical protein n=1 Tax=Burkholderia gladioli TaxID=28095 RepID=UPI001ABAC7E8
SVNRLFFMTSFLRWKPFSQVSTGPKITGQVKPGIDVTLFSNGAVQDEKIGPLLGMWDVILHSLKHR